MKTVVKKVVEKAPLKTVLKITTKKVVTPSKPAKTMTKPAAKVPSKLAKVEKVEKVEKKTTIKPLPKLASKVVVKKSVKAVTKPSVKAAAKPVLKPTTKVASKAVLVKTAEKNNTKAKATAKPKAKPKAASKPLKDEPPLKQPMIIASTTAPQDTKDLSLTAPTQSKARTSRLASLTVPSMAQSVASTAAKSSYGSHAPSLALISPPQFAPKHNPELVNNWKTKTAEEMTDDELLAMPESEYMNLKQMMYFRIKLTQLKQGILASAGATTEHLRDESAVVPDPTDRATIEEEHALELRTRDRERKLLKKIEQSILRIDAGDYGYCDETGEAIGVGRLLARPTATLSLEAQQRRELKQKMFGD